MRPAIQFEVTTSGPFSALTQQEYQRGRTAVKSAMGTAATSLKQAWREQVTAAGLGQRLANTVRSEVYPRSGGSLRSAAMVHTKADKILTGHDQGSVIRSPNGFWLAIPLPAAGPRRVGRQAMNPGRWEKKTGRRLEFVYGNGRHAWLVDKGRKGIGNVMVRKRVRGGYTLADPKTYKNRFVPIFLLVPQVKLKKRTDVASAAARVAATIPGMIKARWNN